MSSLGNKEIMAINLQYYLDKKGITQAEFADAIGLKRTTVNEWIKAKKYPRIDNIEMMANYFGINKSDLVEYKNRDIRNDYIVFDNGKQIDLSDLPVSAREDIEEYVQFLKVKYKKQ
jgi:transcriptional regulator with XRE-family HTH domain